MADRPISERLTRAICAPIDTETPCQVLCDDCRQQASAAAHELANWLDQRFGGSSETAELIRAIYP